MKVNGTFYVYENWTADKHKATIHHGDCAWCNHGSGCHVGATDAHGRWHGPFHSPEEAFRQCDELQVLGKACGHCKPPLVAESAIPDVDSESSTKPDSASNQFDPSLSPEVAAIHQYLDRANYAFRGASDEGNLPEVRAMMTAFCVHACQSLREAFLAFDAATEGKCSSIKPAINSLPFGDFIEFVRHHDIHGQPIPICYPGCVFVKWSASPNKPMVLGSSHGVGVTVQLRGAEPIVSRTKKDLKHATFSTGQSISYHCSGDFLTVFDFSTNKTQALLPALGAFLSAATRLTQEALVQRGKGFGLPFASEAE